MIKIVKNDDLFELIQLRSQDFGLERKNKFGYTFAHLVTVHGAYRIMKYLIETGIGVDASVGYDITPLFIGIVENQNEVA